MKKDILIKTALCTFFLLSILGANYLLFQIYVSQKLSLTSVYIAAKDIMPRHEITEEDMIEVKVPKDYLMDHVFKEKKNILGKYTDIQGKIPAGSLFYTTMLYDAEKLPDRAVLQLREGQTLFTLNTDVSKLGSITEGQRVDLYVSIDQRQNNPVSGLLLRNVRVISVKDHKGIPVNDPESNAVPSFLELAIEQNTLEILSLADSLGEIRLFPSAAPYDTSAEAETVTDSDIYRYLQSVKEKPQEKEESEDKKE